MTEDTNQKQTIQEAVKFAYESKEKIDGYEGKDSSGHLGAGKISYSPKSGSSITSSCTDVNQAINVIDSYVKSGLEANFQGDVTLPSWTTIKDQDGQPHNLWQKVTEITGCEEDTEAAGLEEGDRLFVMRDGKIRKVRAEALGIDDIDLTNILSR